MEKYITITGIKHYYGVAPFEKGQFVELVKEPDNEADCEAIFARLPGLGKVGYVANSTWSVKGECMSAGRLYDKIGDTAKAEVTYILQDAVICRVEVDEQNEAACSDVDEDDF